MPNISNPDNDIVVGFKKEEVTIIDQLIHGSKEREIILITGMGGLGKTTLAKRVYEEETIANHFGDNRAWCTVSQEYDCKDLLNKIYSQLCGSEIEIGSVAEKLRKRLMGRRYLIVLDDIWSQEAWEVLNRVFPSCDNGSRIVLASRQESVVSDAKHICLPFFTPDECWELLQVKLFKENRCPKELENVGREISKKCGGLPLTVSLIAGLLEKVQNSEQRWQEFLLALNSDVTFGDIIQINDAIELSYKYLSDHLKPCLIYFAAFHEDEEIRVSKLIELWISEGFIIGMLEEGRVEDEAVDYLNHLICSNLIMVVAKNYDDRIILCKVHDLVRDFCLTKARDKISMAVINTKKEWPTLNFTPHRICFHVQGEYDLPSKLVRWNSSIRTGLIFQKGHGQLCYSSSWISERLEHLTILDLEAIWVNQSFFSEVNTLIHLRYLALFVDGDENDDISPLSLGNLKCLITLKLQSNKVHFPNFFLNMSRLRHMIINGFTCDKSCMEKSRSVMIEAIPCSKELQTWVLPCPLTPMDEHLLRKFPNLKTLHGGISKYPFPKIDFLHDLEDLKLFCISESHPHLLHDLKLSKFPSGVKEMGLNFITLSVSAISTIAQLPNLKSLTLVACKFEEGLIWNVEEETKFPKLKRLQLTFLDIRSWNISSAAESFPCLENLYLGYCANLQVMPSSFDDVLTLKSIFAKDCNPIVDSWVKEIRECAQEIGNEQLNVNILEPSEFYNNPDSYYEHEPIYYNPDDSNYEHESIHDNPDSNSGRESIHDNPDSNFEHESIHDNPDSNSEHESIHDNPDSNSEHESNFLNAIWNKFKLVLRCLDEEI